MKQAIITKIPKWSALAVLAGTLLCSVLALRTEAVYASSCDCFEARQDAIEVCQGTGNHSPYITAFSCPVGANQDEFSFTCLDGSTFPNIPCSY